MTRIPWLFAALLVLGGFAWLPPVAIADDVPPASEPASDEAELSGDEIYRRVLANRHSAYFQKQLFISGDEGGGSYETELWVRWKDVREDGKAKRGALSKTLAKYTSPRNVRGMGYLVVQKEEPPNDQLVYFPSARRVRRVNLGESIMGTDFSLEDIVPRELENSTNERHADETVGDADCYVVDVVPKPESGSQYSKLRIYVDKEHYVPLRTRYWSQSGIEVKEYRAVAEGIQEVEGVWLTREGTMRDLAQRSHTTVRVLEIEPNANIKESAFSERRLISRSR